MGHQHRRIVAYPVPSFGRSPAEILVTARAHVRVKASDDLKRAGWNDQIGRGAEADAGGIVFLPERRRDLVGLHAGATERIAIAVLVEELDLAHDDVRSCTRCGGGGSSLHPVGARDAVRIREGQHRSACDGCSGIACAV